MRHAPLNLLHGQAGVYRVASKLCLMGLNPYFAAVDTGTDILVEGCRVQVKSAHLSQRGPYPNGAYWFKLGRTTIRKRRQVWENVTFSNFCDFVVFWGIDHDRMWVVPASDVDNAQCVVVGPELGYRDIDMVQLRDMASSGMNKTQIASALGVSPTTVSRRLAGLYTEPDTSRTLCQRVRNCENRWDLIELFIQAKSGCMAELGSLQQLESKEALAHE